MGARLAGWPPRAPRARAGSVRPWRRGSVSGPRGAVRSDAARMRAGEHRMGADCRRSAGDRRGRRITPWLVRAPVALRQSLLPGGLQILAAPSPPRPRASTGSFRTGRRRAGSGLRCADRLLDGKRAASRSRRRPRARARAAAGGERRRAQAILLMINLGSRARPRSPALDHPLRHAHAGIPASRRVKSPPDVVVGVVGRRGAG